MIERTGVAVREKKECMKLRDRKIFKEVVEKLEIYGRTGRD